MVTVPLISVIIPSFNAGAFIRSCLDSIGAQIFTNYEVLIMDGLSTDNTLQIIQSYSDNDTRIRCISEKDKGTYDAMNKGIEKANGDWVLFLGADDELFNDNVFKNFAEEVEHSTDEVVYGNVKLKGSSAWANDGDVYDGAFNIEKLFFKNICHQAIFYKRSVFSKIGNYNITYKISADWDLNHRCFAFCNVRYVDAIVSNFFAGGQSTQANHDPFTDRDLVENLRKYHRLNYFNSIYHTYHWVFFNLSDHYMKTKQYGKSLYYLFFSIWHSRKPVLLKQYCVNFLQQNKKNHF